MRGTRPSTPARLRLTGDVDGLARIALSQEGTPAAQAAALLADIGGRDAANVLLKCVRRHGKRCRVESYDAERLWPLLEAVRGLGRLRERRAVPLLPPLLDPDTMIPAYLTYKLKMAVMRTLLAIGAPQGTDLLLARLAGTPDSADIHLVHELCDPEAVVPLLALLWNMLPGYPVQAVRALGAFRDARTAPAMLYLASSTDSTRDLRRAALQALVDLPDVPWATTRNNLGISTELWRLTRDPDRETAWLAAVLQSRTEDGRQTLISHLRYPHGGHAHAVPESLSSESACVMACAIIREKPDLFDAAEVGPLLSQLLLARKEPRPLRQAAAEALGSLGGQAATATLLDALGHDRIADSAAEVLARLPAPPEQRLLALLADSGDPARRRGAAVALGLARSTAAAPLLLAALDPAGPRPLRAAATDALGLLGHRPAAEPLVAMLTDPAEAPSLQARAVRALGRIGAPETLTAVSAAAQVPSEAVRLRAAEALGGFPTDEAIQLLGHLAGETDVDVARAALGALGRIGTPAVRELTTLLEHAPGRRIPAQRELVQALSHCAGAEAIAALGRVVTGPFEDAARAAAVEALADRPEPERLRPLLQFLDDNGSARTPRHVDVVGSLARIDDDSAVESVIAYFESQSCFSAQRYWDEARKSLTTLATRHLRGSTL
ncbi:HEAT repeat domain-containing protein [Streptomyces sp. PSAA01]|uniref:HEAT repeat domain-containing protein n=1 Tax=Streptomyces sp. PSAA01 TaxID=2912762 RepID=UPI001F1F38D4|nr:HEAT repeat domain-containing protein [Streptomyces sp. PSAA01]MCG0289363.1 HEAT repeat domain-containing protein [Streptomyces sp. PSAA01]